MTKTMDFTKAKAKMRRALMNAAKTKADIYVAGYLVGFIELGGVEDVYAYEQRKEAANANSD